MSRWHLPWTRIASIESAENLRSERFEKEVAVPKSVYFFGAPLVLLSIPPIAFPFAVLIMMFAGFCWMILFVPVTYIGRTFGFDPSTVNAIGAVIATVLIGGVIADLLRRYMREGNSQDDERSSLNGLVVIVGSLLAVAASYWNLVR